MSQEKTFQQRSEEIQAICAEYDAADEAVKNKGKQWQERLAAIFREDLKSNDAEMNKAMSDSLAELGPEFNAAMNENEEPTVDQMRQIFGKAGEAFEKVPENTEYEKALEDGNTVIREITERLLRQEMTLIEAQYIYNGVGGQNMHEDNGLAILASSIDALVDVAKEHLYPAYEQAGEEKEARLEPMAEAAFLQYLKEDARAAQVLRGLAECGMRGSAADISARAGTPVSMEEAYNVSRTVNKLYTWCSGLPPMHLASQGGKRADSFGFEWTKLQETVLAQTNTAPTPPKFNPPAPA